MTTDRDIFKIGTTRREVWATIERLSIFPDTPSKHAVRQLTAMVEERTILRVRLNEADE